MEYTRGNGGRDVPVPGNKQPRLQSSRGNGRILSDVENAPLAFRFAASPCEKCTVEARRSSGKPGDEPGRTRKDVDRQPGESCPRPGPRECLLVLVRGDFKEMKESFATKTPLEPFPEYHSFNVSRC